MMYTQRTLRVRNARLFETENPIEVHIEDSFPTRARSERPAHARPMPSGGLGDYPMAARRTDAAAA